MKFIHLTDTHVVGAGRTLFGGDHATRLAQAVASINAEHADAAFVVVTGDLTHWGDAEAYAAFRAAIDHLQMPVHLMVGNHDDTAAFRDAFPNAPRDANGFVQTAFSMPQGRFLLLDTREPGTAAGSFCAQRRAWLTAQLEDSDEPLFLLMHHPPFDVGIPAMDAIRLNDADTFHDVIAPFKSRIRHLFFGHVHRPIFGNWAGVSFSCMRGLNHQVTLDLHNREADLLGNFEPPAYGVVLIDDITVTVHLHDFTDDSEPFRLADML